MRKYLLLIIAIFLVSLSHAQSFSNKGKDFWVAYGYHQIMNNGNGQQMVLYFATDQVTNITISIPGSGYVQNLVSGAAPTVLTSAAIPKVGAQDARLLNGSVTPENKGIHITSDKPMVAYAHIYNQNVSGASILFPTNTLGKEYYSINYKNISNTDDANCWFYVIAVDTGTTSVEITPSANAIGHPAGVPFTINLTQGQVYNVMGELTSTNNPFTGSDLTGSKIRSISSGTGNCKKIAVYSGSGRISITCAANSSSSDNYMVQAFPKDAWGKKYLTSPTSSLNNNIFRICVADPATLVTVNSAPIATPLINNFYYELAQTSQPLKIEANLPIILAQYIASQGSCGNPPSGSNPGDPEVIYISPVEQNISKVLWNATPNFNIIEHYYNVVIPNTGTAISSFKLDGVTVNPALFTVHPQDAGYSYLSRQLSVSGAHRIESDSGFNAIAYGFGTAESYGYNAGTNIKDLYNFIEPENPFSLVPDPVACTGTPFFLTVTFPFIPTSLSFNFGGFQANQSFPTQASVNAIFDTTYFIGAKQVWRYKIPNTFVYTPANITPGYPINIVAGTTSSDGCGNTVDRDFTLAVYDPPVADMDWFNNGCVTDTVRFRDTTTYLAGTYSYKWYWNFGDGTTDSVRYPRHKYLLPGTYTVKFAMISNVGCFSDTAVETIIVTNVPIANFNTSSPLCTGNSISFTSTSSAAPPGNLQKWFWDFGDGTTQVITAPTSPNVTHTYNVFGPRTPNLRVETNSGCTSLIDTSFITVNPKPVASFTMPGGICLPGDSARFFSTSTIADGTEAGFIYSWNFGDPGSGVNNVSNIKNPVHYYTAGGSYNIKLTITSQNGCVDDTIRTLSNVYAAPLSGFNVAPEACINTSVNFTSTSTGSGQAVSNYFWDFGDGSPIGSGANPTHTYTTSGVKNIRHWIKTVVGCTSDTTYDQVTVNELPTASFSSTGPYCSNKAINFSSSSVANSGTIVTWAWSMGDATVYNFTNGNPFTHTYATSGNKTVTLTVTTDKGCTSTVFSNVITVNPKPITAFTNSQACLPNQSVSFTNNTSISNSSILSYVWNFGDPASGAANTSTLTSPSHFYAATGSYTVQLTATSSDGCIKDSIRTVSNIFAQPRASFTVDPENCLNTITNLTSTSTGSGANITNWFWDFGDATPIGTGATTAHTYANAGTYVIRHWVRTVNGCFSDTIPQTVVVNPLPTANFSFSNPSCENRVINFTNTSIANAGVVNEWTWDFGDPISGTANSATIANPQHIFSSAAIYTVTLTVKTTKGCVSAPTPIAVQVNTKPVAGYINPEVCLDDTYAQFLDTSSVQAGTITAWLWNFDDPISGANNTSTLQNPQHSYTTIGTKNVKLIVTSNSGCKDTTIQSFFVNGDIPVAGLVLLNPNGLCANDSVAIQDASTVNVGSVIKVDIYWDNLGAPTVFERDDLPFPGKIYRHRYPNFQSPPTQPYRIRYRAYSGDICVNDFFQDIVVNAAPDVQFNPIPDTCLYIDPFQIVQASEVGGVPGSFVFSGPGVSTTGVFSPSLVGPGIYTIKYLFTSSAGCTDSAQRTIRILQPPLANFGFSSPVCQARAVTFRDSSLAPVGAITTYTWDFADGSPILIRNTNTPFTHIFQLSGNYPVKLTVTTDDGCSSLVRIKNVLVSPEPIANFSFTDTSCLPNAVIQFNNLTTISDGTLNSLRYLWNFDHPASGTLNISTAVNPSHLYYDEGPFDVKLTVVSSFGCTDDTTIQVNTIHPQPIAAFDFGKPSVCIGDQVSFNDLSNPQDGTALQWSWNFGDNSLAYAQNPTHTYADTGTYQVEFYMTNSFGCESDTISKPFSVYPYPIVNAGPDTEALEGSNTVLQATASGNDLQYVWTPATYLNSSSIIRPTSTPVNDITYTLTVTGRGGCPAVDQVKVVVLKTPMIPNTFSPNGDGINDTWVIRYLKTYPKARVQVFSRTGQLMFESTGYTTPWNGTLNGKPLPMDTYYYIIEPESGRDPVTGYVTIIK